MKQPRVGTGRSRPALEKDRDLGMIHSRLPAPSLRRHIRAYTVPAWTRHTMLFRYGDFFYAYFPDASAVPHLGASLFGATTRPLSYGGTTGRYCFVAVEFRPAVMPALLREHADAFTDCVVEASAFNGRSATSIPIEVQFQWVCLHRRAACPSAPCCAVSPSPRRVSYGEITRRARDRFGISFAPGRHNGRRRLAWPNHTRKVRNAAV